MMDAERHRQRRDEEIRHGERDDEIVRDGAEPPIAKNRSDNQTVPEDV